MPTKRPYNITGSGIVLDSPGLYYGFTCVAGGVSRIITAYDNPITFVGPQVENYTTGTVMGEHEHKEPVYLESGLYVSLSGGSAIVYAWKNPLQG